MKYWLGHVPLFLKILIGLCMNIYIMISNGAYSDGIWYWCSYTEIWTYDINSVMHVNIVLTRRGKNVFDMNTPHYITLHNTISQCCLTCAVIPRSGAIFFSVEIWITWFTTGLINIRIVLPQWAHLTLGSSSKLSR